MKKFRFAVRNWKSDTAKLFWFYKDFPSAYFADRYAMRISFNNPKSSYFVIPMFGEETTQ